MRTGSSRGLLAAVLLAVIQARGTARQPTDQALPCVTASDPEYGFVKEKAIRVGGGAMYAAARERRYLDALRGPEGQALRPLRRGSVPLDLDNPDPTILDAYQLTYEGLAKPVALYLDAYHFGTPQAPQGFTCGLPLARALGPPPIDPFKATSSIAALAIEQGSAGREFAPLPLELSGDAKHGVVFDQFRMIALKAKAAGASGAHIDANKPPPEIARQGLVVLAYPLICGGRNVAPESLEILGEQGPQPRPGNVVRGEAIGALLPGVVVPPMSLAAAYGLAFLRPTDRVKITYADSCEDGSREALLPVKFEASRPLTTERPAMPQGIVEMDPIVYLQAIIDTEGRFTRAVQIGGPDSLAMPALEALRLWRATPLLVNGAPVVTPIVFPIMFR